jgi:hypothetical protein
MYDEFRQASSSRGGGHRCGVWGDLRLDRHTTLQPSRTMGEMDVCGIGCHTHAVSASKDRGRSMTNRKKPGVAFCATA